MLKVNLGCGPVFVNSPSWLNLDYAPTSPAVRQSNLLDRLPMSDETAELIYSSHFLEHVPRVMVPKLLCECLRCLKTDGIIRLVVPDLENLAREYLNMRERGEHSKADFVVIEMIDQCVRRVSGGELGNLYKKLAEKSSSDNASMIDYIRVRTGEDLLQFDSHPRIIGLKSLYRMVSAFKNRIQQYWIRFCILLLPSAFRNQNISLSQVGERHQWLWDFHQIKTELEAAGFTDVMRLSSKSSTVTDFPFDCLDLDNQGLPRKGNESMYIEARKPSNIVCKP
jgi:predicted SAM-dependent methyltransferase